MTLAPSSDVLPFELAREAVRRVPLGIYLHVPFCARRCGYCAFTTYALGDGGDTAAQERYVEGALAEVAVADATLGPDRPPLTSIYVGGGTPTMLDDDQFARMIGAVFGRFEVADDVEVTVEANPDGLRPGQLDALREAGATRVSFGMQSLSRRVLQVLDRTHDPERALAAVGAAREAGFEHVSLDLIHGTPGETAEEWEATLDAVVTTGVDHVSAYALAIEAGTKLAARVRRGSLAEPDSDFAAERYLVAEARLRAEGFEWYELSNWARSPGARCRHNELYWRSEHWWGIGPGAHSHVAGVRWWNGDRPDGWGVAGHEVLTAEQRELERVMLGIRLAEGLPLDDRIDPDGVGRLVADGLLVERNERVVTTLQGRLLADHVVRELVG